jgi:hypothetical protein
MSRGLKLNGELRPRLAKLLRALFDDPKNFDQASLLRRFNIGLRQAVRPGGTIGAKANTPAHHGKPRDYRVTQNAKMLGVPARGPLKQLPPDENMMEYHHGEGFKPAPGDKYRVLRDVDTADFLQAQVQTAAAQKRLVPLIRETVRTKLTEQRIPPKTREKAMKGAKKTIAEAKGSDLPMILGAQDKADEFYQTVIKPNENSVAKLTKVLMDPKQAKNLPPALKKEMQKVIDEHDRAVDQWGMMTSELDGLDDWDNF